MSGAEKNKLSFDDVVEIESMLADNVAVRHIATRFKVDRGTIYFYKRRKTFQFRNPRNGVKSNHKVSKYKVVEGEKVCKGKSYKEYLREYMEKSKSKK